MLLENGEIASLRLGEPSDEFLNTETVIDILEFILTLLFIGFFTIIMKCCYSIISRTSMRNQQQIHHLLNNMNNNHN